MLHFLTSALIILLATISPGPDFAIVTRNSLTYSRRTGLMTTLGISTGVLFHCSYIILGVGIILAESVLLFTIVKFIGAAYLIYLGCKGLLTHPHPTQTNDNYHQKTDLTAMQAFRQGLITNLVNPKGIMFMLSFFTLVLDPHTSFAVQLGYGVTVCVITFAWFCVLALVLSHQHIKQRLNRIQYLLEKTFGILLIGFGARIAFLTIR